VAGRAHHLPGQLHRAGADGAQRPRRHEVRHPLPRPTAAPRSARSGANIPALLRALVACGWFGIQTWIGGEAIYKILAIFIPVAGRRRPAAGAGHQRRIQLASFLVFWAINMAVVIKGIDSIRVLLNIKAPLLLALGLLLLWWAHARRRLRPDARRSPSAFDPGQPKAGQFWGFFFPALTGMVGFWATLSLNIPDFTRYAHTQRDQVSARPSVCP
jgi:NCS1 family nucleobase:cation symporter-1